MKTIQERFRAIAAVEQPDSAQTEGQVFQPSTRLFGVKTYLLIALVGFVGYIVVKSKSKSDTPAPVLAPVVSALPSSTQRVVSPSLGRQSDIQLIAIADPMTVVIGYQNETHTLNVGDSLYGLEFIGLRPPSAAVFRIAGRLYEARIPLVEGAVQGSGARPDENSVRRAGSGGIGR